MPAKGVHGGASVPAPAEAFDISTHGSPDRRAPALHTVLIGDGDVPVRSALEVAWPGWSEGCGLVIAADGGALKAERLGLRPDLVVGDGDSLGPEGMAHLAAAGIPFERSDVAKDESDLELAVAAAVRRGATRITVLGALGGPRLDHALANVWLLAHPAVAGLAALLVDADTRLRLVDAGVAAATASLDGRPGDLVSLFPFGGDAEGITTEGLAYPLSDEPLRMGPARGLSNVRLAAEARVSLRAGRLLVVETCTLEGGTK